MSTKMNAALTLISAGGIHVKDPWAVQFQNGQSGYSRNWVMFTKPILTMW